MSSRSRPFIIPVFLPNRGCPHRCVFCDQSAITGVRKRISPVYMREHVTRFLAYKKTSRGRVEIAFYGGNFLGLDNKETMPLLSEARRFVDQDLVNGIRFSTRPDTITPESLDVIREFPVTTIEIGVQSMDDRVLELSRRGHTASCCAKAILLLKQNGYSTGAQMMTGLPGDTGAQSIRTAEKLASLEPDFVRIYPTVVLKNSPLAAMYKLGRYKPQSLEEAVLLAKKLCAIYEDAKIPVIRIGLQPSEELNSDSTVVAGPYHPAFGYMVRSEILFDRLKTALKAHDTEGKSLTVTLPPGQGATLRGLKNVNIGRIKKMFGIGSIRIVEDKKVALGQIVCSTSQDSLLSP